jgi:hypothetical protein
MPNVWIGKETYLAYASEYENPDEEIRDVVEDEEP